MIRNLNISVHYYYHYWSLPNLIPNLSLSSSSNSFGNIKNCVNYLKVIKASAYSRRQLFTSCNDNNHNNCAINKNQLKKWKLRNRNFTSCCSCFPPRSSGSLFRDIDPQFFLRNLIPFSRLYSCVIKAPGFASNSRRGFTDDCFENKRTRSKSTSPGIKSDENMGVFRFSDYDCVGFDLDNTLLRYKVTNMVTLEYEALSKFMVEDRGYDGRYLLKELTPKDYDFMQKGLILDFERGNILRLSPNGFILRASHGTRILIEEEIDGFYPGRKWEVTDAFTSDFLVTWNGPLSEKMRTLLDYFDMPASVVFAKVIDTLDEIEREKNDDRKNNDNADGRYNFSRRYSVWPDVLDGLVHMFDRQNFAKDHGRYFSTLKKNPVKFMHKSSPELVSWLKELKKQRITFLITGSNADFADFTASYALGHNWRSLFDVVICYAKKPGFFTSSRPFLKVESDYLESSIVPREELRRGEIYSQGNWKELKEFFARECGKKSPACLYVGDNLIQDIYTPKHHANCDTVAIVEEQLAEGMLDHSLSHKDEETLNSKIWGSYFHIKNENNQLNPSLWSHVINNYSKICLPSVDFIVQNTLDTPLKSFGIEDERKLCGYHPAKPKSVVNNL